jgi:uncharacterized membrane protein
MGSASFTPWDEPWLQISLPAYAQAALIITPILFFAAVIRQLIISFVPSNSKEEKNESLTDSMKTLRDIIKHSGSS